MTPSIVAAFIKRDYEGLDPQWVYGSVQANILQWGKEALIIFRGTESDGWDVWLDWFRNLRAYPLYDKELRARAAAGYLKGVKGCLKAKGANGLQMQHALAELARTGHKIHFGGHSKGGGEAAVCAALCVARDVCKPASLTTFGSARPGRFKLPCYCLVNNYRYRGDPVPFVAPWNRHVSKIIQLGGTGKPSVKDHKITHYIGSL